MNILLVEDEIGIREGLAALLRLQGHVVRLADNCADGMAWLEAESFDLVVTDWRLGDGLGAAIVEVSRCPAIVMTGYPEAVDGLRDRVVVLGKPVAPGVLVGAVNELAVSATQAQAEPAPVLNALHELPQDTRDRVALACALVGCDDNAQVSDEGDTIVLRAPIRRGGVGIDAVAALGGDHRILERDGQPELELRLYRNGRSDAAVPLPPHAPWPPAPAPVAVDFDGASLDPGAFVALAEQAAEQIAAGRSVEFLNIPTHLRLHLEIVGAAHLLPKRPKSGPHLPEVLVELWRQG